MPFGFHWDQWNLPDTELSRVSPLLRFFHCVGEGLGNVAVGSYLDDQTSTFMDINGRMFAFLPRCLHILEMPNGIIIIDRSSQGFPSWVSGESVKWYILFKIGRFGL